MHCRRRARQKQIDLSNFALIVALMFETVRSLHRTSLAAAVARLASPRSVHERVSREEFAKAKSLM